MVDMLGLKTYSRPPGCTSYEYESTCTCNLKCKKKNQYIYSCRCDGKGRPMEDYGSRIREDYITGTYEGDRFTRYWCCTAYDRNDRAPEYEPIKTLERKTEEELIIIGQTVSTVVATAGIGYFAYRALRLLPSLIPALWFTIPANLATP